MKDLQVASITLNINNILTPFSFSYTLTTFFKNKVLLHVICYVNVIALYIHKYILEIITR